MLCKKPFIDGMHAYGCGQCMPCRINRRRQWATRIQLESMLYSENAFVTLTYDDDHLPVTPEGLGNLNPEDIRLFLYRFRKAIRPRRVRYFLVGEYGEESYRPHYHLALFNFRGCDRLSTRYRSNGIEPNCCDPCKAIHEAWRLGRIETRCLDEKKCNYVAGYVTKKLTDNNRDSLHGREPEFARMSNRPGIGADAMPDIASEWLRYGLDETRADVPTNLLIGGRSVPLAPYLKKKLREQANYAQNPEAETAYKALLRSMWEAVCLDTESIDTTVREEIRRKAYAEKIEAHFAGRRASVEAKASIFKKRGRI